MGMCIYLHFCKYLLGPKQIECIFIHINIYQLINYQQINDFRCLSTKKMIFGKTNIDFRSFIIKSLLIINN
jgi:hypothetical protein